jgi:8-oxo-dGTP pyrophosphatase MutT (NUDIX family)
LGGGGPSRLPGLDEIVEQFRGHEPRVLDDRWTPWHAATALILHEPASGGTELLFIVRTKRDNDRWSGQVAFPGGRVDPEDTTITVTAQREAREEVGIELPDPVGRLDDQQGRGSLGRVSPFVFALEEEPAIEPQPEEVAETIWVPLPDLVDPDRRTSHRWLGIPFPAIDLGPATLWGLTLRTVETFLETIGVPRE